MIKKTIASKWGDNMNNYTPWPIILPNIKIYQTNDLRGVTFLMRRGLDERTDVRTDECTNGQIETLYLG